MIRLPFHFLLLVVLGELLSSAWTAEVQERHHSRSKCVVKRRNSTHVPKSHKNQEKEIFLREPKIKEDTSDMLRVTGAPGRDVVVVDGNDDEDATTITSALSTSTETLTTSSDTQGQFFGMGGDDFDSETLMGDSLSKSANRPSQTTTTSTTTTTSAKPASTSRTVRSTNSVPTTRRSTVHKVQLDGNTRPQPFRDHAVVLITKSTSPITTFVTAETTARSKVTRTTTTIQPAEDTEVLSKSSPEQTAQRSASEIDDSAITSAETTTTLATTRRAPSTAVTSTSRTRQTKARTSPRTTRMTTTTTTSAAAPSVESTEQTTADNQDVASALEVEQKEKRQEHRLADATSRRPRSQTPRRIKDSSENTKDITLNVGKVADKDDTTGLQRVNGPGTPLLDGSYLSDPWMCRVNKSVVRSPIIMKTCQGVEKQIVDLRVYKLAGIPIEECVTTPVVLGDRCSSLNGGKARCAQRYVRYGLIAKDLDSDKKGHECFRFPSACLCQIISANTADSSPADDVGDL